MFYDSAISVLCKEDVVILFDVVIFYVKDNPGSVSKKTKCLMIMRIIANEAEVILNN